MADGRPLLEPTCCAGHGDPSAENQELELIVGSTSVRSIDIGPAHVGSASFNTALSNLALAVLGAGQLTLPYALRELGWVFGLASLLVFTLLSVHSLQVLAEHTLHFQQKPRDCLESYAELVVRSVGPAGKLVCDALLATYAWGGALSFLVILKEELGYLVALTGLEVPGSLPMALCSLVIILPLSALPDVSKLKRVSPLGCAAALLVTAVVLLSAPWSGEGPLGVDNCSGLAGQPPESQEGAGGLQRWPRSFVQVAAALPLFSFALNSSWAFVPIFCTLNNKTPSRVLGLICGSNLIIIANYVLIALYGYATFCGGTQPNILDSLGGLTGGGLQFGLVLLAKALLSLQLTLALPMRFFVARRTLIGEVEWPARWGMSCALVLPAAGLAALPLQLNTLLGIVSSICASMIIYILPAVMDLTLQVPGRGRKVISLLSLPVGIFVLLAGTLANVMGISAGGG